MNLIHSHEALSLTGERLMEKPAQTQHPIHEVISRRWSPRAFAERMVEREKLLSLFEAARWAPSSYNEQPWSFVVATKDNRAEFDKLLGCLVEGNVAWAQHAPVLALSVAKLTFARNDKPNRHAFHDVGLAAENLVLQATALGLVVHQMAGFYVDKAREAFAIPEGYEPVAAMAIGYPGQSDQLPEPLRQRELESRVRKPMRDFVFSGKWGERAAWLS
jgi:nitroreductase